MAFLWLYFQVELPKSGKYALQGNKVLLMGIYTDDYIVYINIAPTNAFDNKVNQALEIGWTGVKSLGGAVVSELSVSGDAKTSSLQGIYKFLLEKTL